MVMFLRVRPSHHRHSSPGFGFLMPFSSMALDIYRPAMSASLLAVFIDIRLGLTNTQALECRRVYFPFLPFSGLPLLLLI